MSKCQGLDIPGERWTLLIRRELLGGPRRYSGLRAELPGIATNLLAERLKELENVGLWIAPSCRRRLRVPCTGSATPASSERRPIL
jgi:HxlR-like helix-turn-helix